MTEASRLEYQCRRCRYHVSETAGTICAKTRTPLSKWVLAVGLFKLGVAARTLQTELGVTDKTAWTMLTRIRQAVGADPVLRRLSGAVEIDDTDSGTHRKGKRGRGAAGKTPVVGPCQCGGRVRSVGVPALDAQTVQAVIRQPVRCGSRVAADGLNVFQGRRALGYRHATVDHTEPFVVPPGSTRRGVRATGHTRSRACGHAIAG